MEYWHSLYLQHHRRNRRPLRQQHVIHPTLDSYTTHYRSIYPNFIVHLKWDGNSLWEAGSDVGFTWWGDIWEMRTNGRKQWRWWSRWASSSFFSLAGKPVHFSCLPSYQVKWSPVSRSLWLGRLHHPCYNKINICIQPPVHSVSGIQKCSNTWLLHIFAVIV